MRLVDIPHTPPLGGYLALLERACLFNHVEWSGRAWELPEKLVEAARRAADARDAATFRHAEARLWALAREHAARQSQSFGAVRTGGDAA
jgi:hypothetical protein